MSGLSFPAGIPANCPPSDAEDADGEFFRLVKDNPAIAADFKTHAELGILRNADTCMRHGLSIFRKADDAVALYRHFERSYGRQVRLGRFVAKLQLGPRDGKLKATNRPTHHTWWPYADVDRTATFREVVIEVGNDVGD